MYKGRFVFSHLMEFFPFPAFRQCVQRYRGHYKVHRFSCQDQFLCMAFPQLTGRQSLRDTETCLRALQPRLYHVGIRPTFRYYVTPSASPSQGKAHVQRTLRLFPPHGIFPVPRLSTMCSAVPGPLQGASVLLSGSVSLHGVSPTDRSPKPAGHRNMLPGATAQTLPCRHSPNVPLLCNTIRITVPTLLNPASLRTSALFPPFRGSSRQHTP